MNVTKCDICGMEKDLTSYRNKPEEWSTIDFGEMITSSGDKLVLPSHKDLCPSCSARLLFSLADIKREIMI